jgi:hypothetical protein
MGGASDRRSSHSSAYICTFHLSISLSLPTYVAQSTRRQLLQRSIVSTSYFISCHVYFNHLDGKFFFLARPSMEIKSFDLRSLQNHYFNSFF